MANFLIVPNERVKNNRLEIIQNSCKTMKFSVLNKTKIIVAFNVLKPSNVQNILLKKDVVKLSIKPVLALSATSRAMLSE